MAAHRYWRLQLRALGGGTTGCIGELQMRTSIGGSNVVSSGTASASSSQGTYTAAKAFDGLTVDTGAGNGWAGASAQFGVAGSGFTWLAYDFGSGNDKDIQEIVISCPGTGGIGPTDLPTAWNFQWSDDGANWTTQRAYQFTPDVAAWTASTSRIYDVRPLGAIDIHNYVAFQEIKHHPYVTPGQPSAPVYDPDSPEGQLQTGDRSRYYSDLCHGGLYKIAGSTTSLGDPVPRRVRLYYQFDGRIYAEQYTTADGLFEFDNLAIGPWTVVGIDDTGTQNGVIYSHINAVPM